MLDTNYQPRDRTLTLRKREAQTIRNLLQEYRWHSADVWRTSPEMVKVLQRAGQLANLEGIPFERAAEELRMGWIFPSRPAS